MRIMNVRNFRAAFPTLTEPVFVISREKALGTWTPNATERWSEPITGGTPVSQTTTVASPQRPTVTVGSVMTQARRDAILRKVNRTGRE